jgi:hypothetical protein
MIRELELVVLLHDVDEFGLQRGDIGTVVHAYTNGPAYEVEFVTADGDTVAVLALTEDEIRPRQGKELLHIRSLAGARFDASSEETPATSSKR